MPQAPSKIRWIEAGICALLAALVWAVFGQTIHYQFVNFDDDRYVYENAAVRQGINSGSVPWAFTHLVSSNWHPLTMLSHMLDCQLYDGKPGLHHLTNVLLHTATVILLFLFLQRLMSRLWLPAFVAAVFAIHPLRAESVAWIAERKDVLSGFFFVLTLFAYLIYAGRLKTKDIRSKYFFVMAIFFFTLGLLSKPMLVSVPVILLLLDWWPMDRFKSPETGLFKIPRRVLLEKIPFVLLSLAMCVVTLVSQKHALHSAENISFGLRVGNVIVSTVIYMIQLFYPARLAVFYPFPIGGWPFWKIVLSLVALLIVSAVAVLRRDKQPWLLFGWLWFLVMLLPVIGLVQVAAQAHADRYTYLPEIGLCLALALAISEFTKSWPLRRALLGIGAAIIIATLTIAARAQTAFWRDNETLWTHTLNCTSRNAIAEGNYAVYLLEQGRLQESAEHSRAALEINPTYSQIHNCLGYALMQMGRLDDAMNEYKIALNLRPDFAAARLNLGIALLNAKRFDDAIAELQAAIKIRPDLANAHNVLALALLHTGQPAAAVMEYESALHLEPNSLGACNNLAWLLATYPDASVRNGAQAIPLAQRAVMLARNDNLIALRTLAASYAEAGRFPEAIQTASQALQEASATGRKAWVQAIQSDIQSYQANQPLRETPQ